ncbi:hypothetical protein [Paenibacillus dendritiformis]|uniref:hypothetical protein n=1 Tax=Paenibacillus dendritiformis TaxID=130049 RepID=UPI0018CDB8B1|nr:hypothetical protein [Paenibacillus dendritiformis]
MSQYDLPSSIFLLFELTLCFKNKNIRQHRLFVHSLILAIYASNTPYYEFSLTKVDCPNIPCNTKAYSTTKFDVDRRYLTIKGWQDTGTSTEASVAYQVVVKGWFSDDVKGEKIIQGNYSKKGTWYEEQINVGSKALEVW